MIELHVERTDEPSRPAVIKKFSAPTITIGRASESELSLDDPSVSRRHCRLSRGADGWTLEDLGSANGTLLDDERIADIHPVTPDTRITVGIFRLTLVLSAAPLAPSVTHTTPAWARAVRKLALTSLAVTLAGIGGWTSARVFDAPLRLPAPALDCPRDDPAVADLEALLAQIPTTTAEDATDAALAVLARAPALPTSCGFISRAEAALAAALTRMDHQRLGRHDAPVHALVAHADGTIAAIDRDGRLMLWHREHRGRPLAVPTSEPTDLLALARSPDGRWLTAGAEDGRILLWDLDALDAPATSLPHGARPVSALQFADPRHLWSIDAVGTLHTWTLGDTWTRTATSTLWPGVHTLTALHDGRMLAFGADRAAVVPPDMHRPIPLTTGAALRTIAVTATDIIAGDLAGKVTRWRITKTLRPEPLTAHGGPVRAVTAHDGLVASIGDDDALRLVELGRRVRRRGPPLVLLAEVPVPVDRLVITGDTLIGSGPEGAVITWDLSQRTRRLPASLHDGHHGPITALAATPSAAITAGEDGFLRAWPTVPAIDSDAPLLTRACAVLGWDAPGCDPSPPQQPEAPPPAPTPSPS
jgi:hypothetical protein